MAEGTRLYEAFWTFEEKFRRQLDWLQPRFERRHDRIQHINQHFDRIQHRLDQYFARRQDRHNQYLESLAVLVAKESEEGAAKCADMVDSESKAPELLEQEESAEISIGDSTCDHSKATSTVTISDESSELIAAEGCKESFLVSEVQLNSCAEFLGSAVANLSATDSTVTTTIGKGSWAIGGVTSFRLRFTVDQANWDTDHYGCQFGKALVVVDDSFDDESLEVEDDCVVAGILPKKVKMVPLSWVVQVTSELVLETETPFAKLRIRCSEVALHLFDETPRARIVLVFDPGGGERHKRAFYSLGWLSPSHGGDVPPGNTQDETTGREIEDEHYTDESFTQESVVAIGDDHPIDEFLAREFLRLLSNP